MKFGTALDRLTSGEATCIRRLQWSDDVSIKLQPEEFRKAQYLYVESRFGIVPWIPNMIELVTYDDWMAI